MNQFKRAKVIMLPTKAKETDKVIIYKPITDVFGVSLYNQLLLISTNPTYIRNVVLQNQKVLATNSKSSVEFYSLYIISDDNIEKADWYINLLTKEIKKYNYNFTDLRGNKKIIAAIDTTISPNSLQAIVPKPSQQFIEKYIESYNKGEIITDVLIEYINEYSDDNSFSITNNPIKVNQILKVNPKDNTITIKKLKDSWNREEVISLIHKVLKIPYFDWTEEDGSDIDKWIEDNL
jgi:hypothetical protein